MKICGLQKLTLLDFPDLTSCTVFTGGCNFRCPFCHNAALVTRDFTELEMDEEEILAFLKKRRGLLDGVCVTGGEPLLQPDLAEFLKKVRELGFQIKLDTNGSFPDRLKKLVRNGLADYVAMDVKCGPESYGDVMGIPGYDASAVEESIDFLLTGAVPYEFRTTLVKGLNTPENIVSAAKRIRGADKYFLQQFVDSGDLIGSGYEAFSRQEMESFLGLVRQYVKNAEIRGV